MSKKIVVLSISVVAIVVTAIVLLIVIPRKAQVVITVFGDFSNGESAWAQIGYNGAMMMVNEVNSNQDNVTYVLEKVDSSEYESEADILSSFDNLNTDIIIGPFLSSQLTVYADMLMESGYIVFVPSATHDVITAQDDTVYRLMNATSNQGSQTAQLFDRLGYENIYGIYDTNNQGYTKEIMNYFAADPSLSDATVTTYELVDTIHDFRGEITTSYDAIFICGSGDRTAVAINTIRSHNINQPIFICTYSDSAVFLDTIDPEVDDVYLFSNRNIQYINAYDIYESGYLALYDSLPSVSSTYTYESLYMIHRQLEAVDFDVSMIPERIDAIDQYKGFFVTFYSDDYGDFHSLMTIYEIHNKMFYPIIETQID